MMTYEQVYKQAQQLPARERLLLADALLAEDLGFGMWRDQPEMADVTEWVARQRAAAMQKPNGQVKTPEEFLRELEAFDE